MKKKLSIILVALMMATMIPQTIFAASDSVNVTVDSKIASLMSGIDSANIKGKANGIALSYKMTVGTDKTQWNVSTTDGSEIMADKALQSIMGDLTLVNITSPKTVGITLDVGTVNRVTIDIPVGYTTGVDGKIMEFKKAYTVTLTGFILGNPSIKTQNLKVTIVPATVNPGGGDGAVDPTEPPKEDVDKPEKPDIADPSQEVIKKITDGIKATKITKVQRIVKQGKVTLAWKKSPGYKVDGYQIYKSSKKTSGFVKVATRTSQRYTNTKELKTGKIYYYKIRGYRVVDGNNVYTKWAKVRVVAK